MVNLFCHGFPFLSFRFQAMSNQEAIEIDSGVSVLIVRGWPGAERSLLLGDLLSKAARDGARIFNISCAFEKGGSFAGIRDIFAELVNELRLYRPDLVERHGFELCYILPELKDTVRCNLSLAESCANKERFRYYAADRFLRVVHGLINLLDDFKSSTAPDRDWVIGCDSYDLAGQFVRRFLPELMRRRGQALRLHLILSVDSIDLMNPKMGFDLALTIKISELQNSDTNIVINDSASTLLTVEQLEERCCDDDLEDQSRLAELIRLSMTEESYDKLIYYRHIGMVLCYRLGLYEDALRYSDDLLQLSKRVNPANEQLCWSIIATRVSCFASLGDINAGLSLAIERVAS